jgi:predicted RNA-binding protein (TIGR00451 family)
MSFKREIGSKQRKKILKFVNAPFISSGILENDIRFIEERDSNPLQLLYNKEKEIRFFKYEDRYLPTLKFIRDNPKIDLPIVKVDQGAVPHVLNGADIFTQGITNFNRSFERNSIVMISNPQGAILALGKTLLSSSDLLRTQGKGIINIHHLGDPLWKSGES